VKPIVKDGRRSHVLARALCSPYAAAVVVLLAAAAALTLSTALPPQSALALLKEGGPVERPSEILHFAVAVAVWLGRPRGEDWRTRLCLSIVFVGFGAREMDLHKAWTGKSVLKATFYLHPGPLFPKLAAAAVVLTILLAAAYLAARYARPVWRALQRRDPVAVSVACFVATLSACKLLDRSVNFLAENFDLHFALAPRALIASFEEIFELSLPIIAVVALLQHRMLPGRSPTHLEGKSDG
jgi:hypothetical protein